MTQAYSEPRQTAKIDNYVVNVGWEYIMSTRDRELFYKKSCS